MFLRVIANVCIEHASETVLPEVHHEKDVLDLPGLHFLFIDNDVNEPYCILVGGVLGQLS